MILNVGSCNINNFQSTGGARARPQRQWAEGAMAPFFDICRFIWILIWQFWSFNLHPQFLRIDGSLHGTLLLMNRHGFMINLSFASHGFASAASACEFIWLSSGDCALHTGQWTPSSPSNFGDSSGSTHIVNTFQAMLEQFGTCYTTSIHILG